jgi:hypothetical protein
MSFIRVVLTLALVLLLDGRVSRAAFEQEYDYRFAAHEYEQEMNIEKSDIFLRRWDVKFRRSSRWVNCRSYTRSNAAIQGCHDVRKEISPKPAQTTHVA